MKPSPDSRQRSGSVSNFSRNRSAARLFQPSVVILASASPVLMNSSALERVVAARERTAPGLPSMWKSGTAQPPISVKPRRSPATAASLSWPSWSNFA